MLLLEPEYVDGLSTKDILSHFDEKATLRSSKGKSLYRRLNKMIVQGTITPIWNQKKKTIIYVTNALTPPLDYLKKKYFDASPPPYAGVCGKGCWFAKNNECICKCNGKYHGKGNEQKKTKSP